MVIRSTANEADISGSVSELRRLSTQTARIADGEVLNFEADTAVSPSPYDATLAHFEVTASDGPVKVTASGSRLQACGSPEMLHKLASFFDFADGTAPGTHNHYDWFEGNPFVSCDSTPLVIRVA
jgi:hypothetical protein